MTGVVVKYPSGVVLLQTCYADLEPQQAVEAAFAYLKAEGFAGEFKFTACHVRPSEEVSP